MAEAGEGERRRFSLLSYGHEQYIFCLVLLITFPLLPLLLELWAAGRLSSQTVTLLGSVYAVSLTRSSRSGVPFVTGLIWLVLPLMFAFGYSVGHGSPLRGALQAALLVIALVAVAHALERWARHVLDLEPYLLFM